ncbi:uncharacterized protein [Heterodontus francisci]|uniref:uncharacterized protein n=1 Tax=Heterodontus francisci TaxID=7792 RepID=UPI00355BAE06
MDWTNIVCVVRYNICMLKDYNMNLKSILLLIGCLAVVKATYSIQLSQIKGKTEWTGKMGWRQGSKIRTQGSFTCEAGNLCEIGNWTGTCKGCGRWVGHGKVMFTLSKGKNVTLKIEFKEGVKMACSLDGNISRLQDGQWKHQWAYNGTEGMSNITGKEEISLNTTHWYLCKNSTPISNRNSMVQLFYVRKTNQQETPMGHLQRLHSTCTQVLVSPYTLNLTIQVQYNNKNNPNCSVSTIQAKLNEVRGKRDIGTVLGGLGTGLGALNAIDLETLQNKIQQVGGLTGDVIRLRNGWDKILTATVLTQWVFDKMRWEQTDKIAKVQKDVMKDQEKVNNHTQCMFEELTKQLLRAELERIALSGHSRSWIKLFNFEQSNLEIRPDRRHTICDSKGCNFTMKVVNSSKAETWCQFLVLPHLFGDNFWYPEFIGKWVDQKNRTHETVDCQDWPFGKVCPLHTPVYEPCSMQHSQGACEWTLKPNYDTILHEIGQNQVCISGVWPVYIDGTFKKPPLNTCIKDVYTIYDPHSNKTYQLGRWTNVDKKRTVLGVKNVPPTVNLVNLTKIIV